MIKQKKYPFATLEYNDTNNVLVFRVKQDIHVEAQQMIEMISYVEDFIGAIKHYAIIDLGHNVNSSAEARKIYAECEFLNEYRLADALLVKSLPIRLIANFFIKMNKPKVKTKLFFKENEAIAWLESLKLQNKMLT